MAKAGIFEIIDSLKQIGCDVKQEGNKIIVKGFEDKGDGYIVIEYTEKYRFVRVYFNCEGFKRNLFKRLITIFKPIPVCSKFSHYNKEIINKLKTFFIQFDKKNRLIWYNHYIFQECYDSKICLLINWSILGFLRYVKYIFTGKIEYTYDYCVNIRR